MIGRLKKEGYTIILVEGSFHFARTVADRHYVVEEGHVVDTFPNSELEANMDKLHDYLGV
jgi:branched-chain amino acid transport system ATP-binding protein